MRASKTISFNSIKEEKNVKSRRQKKGKRVREAGGRGAVG